MSENEHDEVRLNDKSNRSSIKGRKPRYRKGALLCHATNREGEPCGAIAISGARVCRTHGGATPQVKRAARLRLAELVSPAIATLAREMTKAEKSADRQRAANSILDRAGIGRVQKIEGADARELLKQRLIALKEAQEVAEREAITYVVDAEDKNQKVKPFGETEETDKE